MKDDIVIIFFIALFYFAIIVLGIFTIILKLTGAIDWSWLWVFAPFWIGILISVFVAGVTFIYLTLFGN